MRLRVRSLMLLILAAALGLALWLQVPRSRERVAKAWGDVVLLRSAKGSSHLCGLQAEARGNQILFAAAADDFHKNSGYSYVWGLRILDPTTRRVVYVKRYDDRLVKLGKGEHRTVTLADVLTPELPPGDYEVSLTLVELSPGAALDSIDLTASPQRRLGPSEGVSDRIKITLGTPNGAAP